MNIGIVSLLEGQEGFSVPSKTYGMLAAGVPVIAIIKGNSEIKLILKENSCGTSVDPGDSQALVHNILDLYQNNTKRKMMGTNATKIINEKINISISAQKYIDTYYKIKNEE